MMFKNKIENEKLKKENKKLRKKLEKIISYAKDRCDDYLKDDYDCEYCDGVFANSRKILQIAGEDIKKYE